jgi:hypothetical protein
MSKQIIINPNCYSPFYTAESIEEILCLGTLIAIGELTPDANMIQVKKYFDNLKEGCDSCQYSSKCMACIMND